MTRRFASFVTDETGTASIEFLFVMPTLMLLFMASFESGLFMARHVMLERSVDMVVRDIRLGKLDYMEDLGMTQAEKHAELKKLFCERGALVEDMQGCINKMRIWMHPVNSATFSMDAPPRDCPDTSAPIDLNNPDAPPVTSFKFGTDNEIMLLRICLKEDPMFPTTVIGAALIADGENDGSYALLTTSVFVNEPG